MLRLDRKDTCIEGYEIELIQEAQNKIKFHLKV
jgi:hypothetical protein